MDTNIKTKEKYYQEWCDLVWGRLVKGGKVKYKIAGNPNREVTDVAADIEPDFMLGDMIKYIGEYKNTRKPKCLFDNAGFSFIKWLKDHK